MLKLGRKLQVLLVRIGRGSFRTFVPGRKLRVLLVKIELFSVSHRVLTFPRGGSTQDIREVDHSFSFNYDRKGYPFPDSRSYCGEFARKVIGSSREFPPVESPIAKNLYQIWACKEVQVCLSYVSRFVAFIVFCYDNFLFSFLSVISRLPPEMHYTIFSRNRRER